MKYNRSKLRLPLSLTRFTIPKAGSGASQGARAKGLDPAHTELSSARQGSSVTLVGAQRHTYVIIGLLIAPMMGDDYKP
jgi:hypothetical protein